MKYAKLMMALTVTMLPMFAVAQFKSSDKIVAQVPFEFVVANKPVPAGEWTVQAATADARLVTIRNGEAKMSLLANISPVETRKTAGAPALVFHKYGDRYFLYGMKIEGTDILYRMPVNKAEAELRAQNVPATEKILLASLQ
jgi:hypothetical protein